MVLSESETINVSDFRGAAGLYRCLFVSCFLLFLLSLTFQIGTKVWLGYQLKGEEGKIAAIETELTSIKDVVAIDVNEMNALDVEELSLADSEQLFKDGKDRTSVWRADIRWSEMGKARLNEIWKRRETLQVHLMQHNALLREKTASLMAIKSQAQQSDYLAEAYQYNRIKVYAIMLVSGLGMILSLLFWYYFVQRKVNRILLKLAQ